MTKWKYDYDILAGNSIIFNTAEETGVFVKKEWIQFFLSIFNNTNNYSIEPYLKDKIKRAADKDPPMVMKYTFPKMLRFENMQS